MFGCYDGLIWTGVASPNISKAYFECLSRWLLMLLTSISPKRSTKLAWYPVISFIAFGIDSSKRASGFCWIVAPAS